MLFMKWFCSALTDLLIGGIAKAQIPNRKLHLYTVDGSTNAFMWEWLTTKPFIKAGP